MRRTALWVSGAASLIVVAVALVSGHGDPVDALALVAFWALAWSRRYPRATWLFATAVTLVSAAHGSFVGGDETIAYMLLPAHAFFSGRWDPHWRGLGGPVALAIAGEIGAAVGQSSRGFFVFVVLAAWFGGRAVRGREELAAQLAERNRELDEEQEAYARLSVRYERARIAAELHDIVAHAISVMVIQAGAGQRLAANNPQLTREAFAAIAGAAREAEGDLERLVSLLGDRDATASAPALALVEELVARAASSGLDVRLRLEGDTESLPTPILALAHRVVQEGVTNALRYGSGATVHVLVRGDQDAMVVEVANGPAKGDGGLAGAGTGNGLRGLRERAASIGGTVHAGLAPDGGWRLTARLPRGA
ncbi:MAG TPA: histidine kinase [Gaiellales bacterium]|jgi:signal transduction histidine kinase|nr:histidine kinase [Gaiellales bacterium]